MGSDEARAGVHEDRKTLAATLPASEQLWHSLAQNLPDFVIVVDRDGQILWLNHTVEGATVGEIIGTNMLRWTPPESRETVSSAIEFAFRGGGPVSYEVEGTDPLGRSAWYECRVTPIWHAGTVLAALVVARDLTERKRAEGMLRQSEQHYAEAYRLEQQRSAHLQSLDEMKNAFMTAVSHELRTPLTAMLGFARTLEDDEGRLDHEERRDAIHRLSANARKLERLLGDLLDLDRLRRGIIEPMRRATDLGALARRVVREMDLQRVVRIEAEELVVDLDGAKVERIIENLVANAARHTPSDAAIWLRIAAEDGGCLIAVEDEGPGVPEEMRAAVFDAFRRGNDTSAHAPGVGIGLSLVRRFAELHGGRAWVEERAGGGASFRVSLPGA